MCLPTGKIRSLAAALVLSLSPTISRAVDVETVSIHGALSATAAHSDRYNYLGRTADATSLNIVEAILNGSHRFDNGARFAAQIYSYKLGDYNSLALDFASFDYAVNERFGVRLGRVKHPFGLYGDAQDVDIVRPFAFLPLDYYGKTFRPLDASLDGTSIYGNLSLGKAGSVDYQIFGGWFPAADANAPLFQELNASAPYQITHSAAPLTYGGWLAWNLPVDGLRLSASVTRMPEINFETKMRSSGSLALATSDARLLPLAFPPGVWDLMVAGQSAPTEIGVTQTYLGVEYTRGNWQYAAEASYTTSTTHSVVPLIGQLDAKSSGDSYYASATWQALPKLQFGSYYGVGYGDRHDRDGSKLITVPRHTNWLKDFAFASSYSLTSSWLLKAEVHLLNGTKGLSPNNGDAAKWKANWNYFVLKSTFSF